MDRHPKVNPRAAVEWLQTNISEGPWTLAALHPSGIPPKTLTTDSVEEAINFVDHWVDNHGIYYNANPAIDGIRRDKKLGKDDVAIGRFVQADFDHTDEGIRLVLAPGAKDALVERLRNGEIGPGRPTIINDSGNGIQALWRLEDEVDLSNRRARDEFEGYGRWIADHNNGDHCWTVNHLFRLPHTMNWPNDKKLEEDLVPIPTEPIESTGQLYQQWEFEWDKIYPSDHDVDLGAVEYFETVEEMLDAYYLPGDLVERIIGDRLDSDAEWAAVKDLLKHGVQPEAVMGIMLHPEWGIGARAREQDERGVRKINEYIEYTVKRAATAVGVDRAKQRDEFGDLDERWDTSTEGSEGSEASERKPKSKYKWTGRDFVESYAMPEPDWLIEGLILERKIGLLWGAPGAGKTFMAIDMACRIAAGLSFFGLDVTPGRVLYIAAEGDEHYVGERFIAWCRANEVDPETIRARIVLIYKPVMINNKDQIVHFLNDIKAQYGRDFALVVVDTMNKNMAGAENDQEVMTSYFLHADKVKHFLGAAIMIIHHTGKDGMNYRGSSVIGGQCDFMVGLTTVAGEEAKRFKRPKDVRALRKGKVRDDGDGESLYFHFAKMLMGLNKKGKERFTRYFQTLEAAETGYQNEASSEGRVESDTTYVGHKRAPKGMFAPVVDMKGLLLEIFAEPPKAIKELVDEEVPGRSERNIYRLIKDLRAAKLLSKKGFVVTDNGKSYLGEKAMMDVLSTDTDTAE